MDSAAEKDAEELIPMLQSNHSKGDDGLQSSTPSASRSHVLHGHLVPAVAAADERLTSSDASSAHRRSIVDPAAISVTPGVELGGERHNVRRDSRRSSNVGKSSSPEVSFLSFV